MGWSIWKRRPNGETQRISFPQSAHNVTRVNGIVITDQQEVKVVVLSQDEHLAGVWQIYANNSFNRMASLPPTASPNGMAHDGRGNLYIADDLLGCIWRVVPGASKAEVWSTNALLARNTTPGTTPYGADGIKVFHEIVYVSNPSQSIIVRIPIQPQGRPGIPKIQFQGSAFANSDDFAFDIRGNLYIANILDQTIIRVDPTGHVFQLLDQSNGFNNPTAVAFGGAGKDRFNLYITNGAFNPQYPEGSLQRKTLGMPGYSIP
ncbi:SMP-30/gluconolactonase/LRE family protein [Dictyobacter alpinus]|uniref:SMP-30/gluconolactonase/LRE family protein n=1 Tax=Dictyobacter alpinus TaxID=2014873 RepID=UPI00353117CF